MRPTYLGWLSVLTATLSSLSLADSTLDWPVGEVAPYPMDSGVQANDTADAGVLFRGTVRLEGVAWLRLYFGEVILGEGSSIRMTALMDGAVQELDAAQMQMWRDRSAYFNGDAVMIELIAGPDTVHNRFILDMVTFEIGQAGIDGSCGICGPDDRVPSAEDWAGRILPAGCTGSVWNEESCVVSAGHCGGSDVLQFRVPASNPDCSLNHPPPADQFPITSRLFENNGVGGDWAVMTTGTNNLNETAYERYGLLRRIATIPVQNNDPCVNWGYGVDQECVRNQIQQTHDGSIIDVNSTNLEFDVDITFGNSGSSLLNDGQIIGIVTHCTENCPPNFATRMDLPAFIAARNSLCAPMSPHTFGPASFAVQFGVIESGGLTDLQDSDDQKLVIQQRSSLSPLLPVVRLFVDGYAAFSTQTQLDVVVEAAASALPANVPQRVELWNFDTNSLEIIDERAASSTDSVTTIEITSNPGRFIRPNSNYVLGYLEWFDPGMTFFVAWNVAVDQVSWTVTP